MKTFSYFSKYSWIKAVVISSWFYLKYIRTSTISIKGTVVHWMNGAYVLNKRITYYRWYPCAQKRPLNLLINSSENHFNLKSHVELVTFISSVISTTSQYSITSIVSISLQPAFQYSSVKGPIMAFYKFGFSAFILSALAFRLFGEPS